jgi:phage terminase small subunit
MPRTARALTERQERFVAEYLRDFNARAAAVRAGYGPRWAGQKGWALLQSRAVAAAIEERVAREEERILLDADRVLLELRRVAFSDIRTYLVADEDGTLAVKPRAALAPGATAALAQLSLGGRNRPSSIRLHGKLHALRALVRHLGLHQQRHYVDPAELNRRATIVFAQLLRDAGVEEGNAEDA